VPLNGSIFFLLERGVKNGARGLSILDSRGVRESEPRLNRQAVAALHAEHDSVRESLGAQQTRLHRAEAQRVNTTAGHHLDGQAASKKRWRSKSWTTFL
jgi:L-2-hydroxyglutarate oxidase LhgO